MVAPIPKTVSPKLGAVLNDPNTTDLSPLANVPTPNVVAISPLATVLTPKAVQVGPLAIVDEPKAEEKLPEAARILFNGEPLITEESKLLRQTSMKNPET